MGVVEIPVMKSTDILLRPFNLDDIEAMYNNWASDSKVTKYLSWDFHKNLDETKVVIANWIDQYNNSSFYHWCIEYMPTKEAIGSIGVVCINRDVNIVEIGYCLSRQYWNKGIMKKALRLLVDYLLSETEFNKLISYHDNDNFISGKVMQNAGFTKTSSAINSGDNRTMYSITKSKYYNNKSGGKCNELSQKC